MRLPILLALLGLFVHNAYLQSLNCYVPADIMILLDGSDSIQDRDWIKMKEFVQLLIDNFDIARDAIHLGMVVYSSRIGDHIGLNSFKDKNMLKLLAGALNHPKDSTNTAKGIEYVREKFRMDGRPGVPKIAIVITDGSSDNPRATKMQANAAKNEGIKVLAVGVGGHMFKDELRSIASRPSKVFTSPTFGTLITLVSEIRNMVCQVITTTTTTTTTPKIPTQPPIYVPPPKDKICNVPGDIVFLMDGSDSISDADFIRQKAFVANMIDNFEISPEAIHVGMVVFSTMIGDVIGLQPAKGKPLLKILAKSLKQPKIGTNTAKGIQRVRRMMAEEGRQFAPKLAVVITDGRSTRPQETIKEANLAKAEGITMIAIGVGTEIFSDELRQLASTPQQSFEVRDFSRLGEIINTMRDLICQEIKTTTSTTTTTEMPTPPPSRVPPPEGLICNVPADIGILLDGSDSIDDRGFIKEKNFAANLINNLDIGPDTIHASVIVYSTLIGQTIPFTPFKPKTLLTILTRNLKQPKVGTNTAKGINKMREYFRTQGRPNAPKVMVIVTDGRSTRPSETIAEAELAKREGIVVIAVGVGTQIFRDELRQIATNERKLFEVSDFAALQRIIIAIRDLICQVITTTPPMTTTTPLPPTTTLEPIPNCDVPAEIMFMLQGSGRASKQNWSDSKQFLSTLVNNMYVSPGAHHYGVIVYGNAIGDHVGLQPYKDKFTLQNYFNSLMKPASSGSDVAEALKKMREMFKEQGRPSAPKIGIMLTNDPTSSPRLSMAETDLAKTEGVKLFTIGVGDMIDRGELLKTATSEKHVMLTPNTRSLQSILPNLRHLICDEIQTPITTRPPRPSHNFTSLCAGCLYDRGTGYNFFPGDCSKYVQCWESNGYVHGVVKDCPFGEFWKQDELKCRPAVHVHCPMDPCLHAPNGFTYGMTGSGCRAYWICVDSHSVGSCCAPGTHYVEGMGCMRGLACEDACPPNGGKIYTPCKKQAHWDRRFYMDDVPQQKLVRHCSPGTIFSKEYCTCIPDMEGLIPVLPGDQCKASAYLPFDVDLEDKSGSNTAVIVQNVTMTPYGSAHFSGNSALTMYKYADVRLGDKLLISFKFKFDRWPDSLDHAGRVVDFERGETHWRFDIQSKTWTRNITIGGGWDAQRLTRMFRKLMGSTNAQQMNLHMIEIANSPDFKALLYHLGFMPDATNALQILRIIFSGQGSNLINQILQKIGNVHGSMEVRKLLYNLLRIEGMNKWIHDHTGRNHKHVLINWQRFLNTLNLNEKDWNRGKIPGLNVDHNMGKLIADLWRIFVNEHGMNTKDWKDILKITFAGDKNGHLGIEFLGEIEGVLGRNRTIKDLWFDFLKGRNVSVSIFGNYTHETGGEGHKTKHQHFLRYIEDLVRSGKGGEWLNYVLGGGKIQTDHGGFTHDGIGNIADIWREYVIDTRLDQDSSMHPHLTWTLTGGGTDGQRKNILIEELRNVLGNDTIRNHFMDFLRKYDVNIVGTNNGWKLIRGGSKNDVGAWLYWLFTQTTNNQGGSGTSISTFWPWLPGGEGVDGWDLGLGFEWMFGPGGLNNGGRVGITTNGLTTLADLWQLFITENPLDRNTWGNKLTWTLRSGNNGYRDYFLLLREMRHVLSNEGMLKRWQEFLPKHNYNIVLNNNGWDVVKGGSRNDFAAFITWLFVVVDEIESSAAGTDFDWIFGKDWKTGITSAGMSTLAELWTRFMQETNVNPNVWGRVLFWTLRTNTGTPELHDYILLLREMRHVLADDYMRQLWVEFLQRLNINIVLTHNGWDVVRGGSQNHISEFIFWLFATVDEIESSNSGTDFSWLISGTGLNNLRISITQNGLQSLMNLWDLFMVETTIDKNKWGKFLFWTLRTPSDTVQNQHYVLLLKEMRHLLADSNIRNLWLQFLSKHNYNIVLLAEGWDLVKGGSTNDASAFIFWLFNIVDSIENSSITDIDWIFTHGKQSWDRYIRRGFTTTGLRNLVVLWEQFLSHIHLDTATMGNHLYWTHRKPNNGGATHQDYLLLFREMRHLLDNELLRNQFIDFMANSGYNIVLTTVGWEIELGGTRNDIAGFIYWLVTTVDTIESSTSGTIIDWLFITDVTSFIGTSSQNKFSLNGIRSLSKLWEIFLARNREIPQKWGKKLLWTLRNVKGADKVNYILLLQEMRNILIMGELKIKWKKFLDARKCKITFTNNGWDCYCGSNVSKDDTDSFIYWLFKSFSAKEWHHSTRLKLNSRIPFAPSGIEAIARFWRFFISKNNVRKRGWRKYICWSKSRNKNYLSLLKEMRNILGLSSGRRLWLRCMKSKNRHIVLTNEGWDVLSQGYTNDNKLWVYWLFTAFDELMSTSNRAQYDWWFAGKGNYTNWRVVYIPSGGHRGRPSGPVVRKYYWEFDEEGWHKTLFTGYPSSWFGLKYGFSKLGQKYIMNLWKAFISRLKLQNLSWNNYLPWSDREDFSESLSEYIDFITEMQILLSNSSQKDDWLRYLKERRIRLSVTENGWDVTDDDHDADNSEWVKWLLLFPFADSGSSWIGGSSSASSSGGFSGQRVNSAFGEGWSNMLFGGPSDSHSGESSSGGSSTESLDSILKSLSNGFAGGSGTTSMQDSQEYYSGGFGMGDMFGLLAAEEFLRKKRSTDNVVRHKRQAHAPFHYQSLVGNCHGNNPSIDIAANERNVKMTLQTDGSSRPGEVILPIVQGWNEVTLVYNGREMHGMVNNWQGEKKTSIPMRGNVQSRPEGISLGYCPKYDGLQGKMDDFVFYECIPLATQNKIGRS